jgi:hypothetical protein
MNQGTKWLLLMKKNRSQKSRVSVPLTFFLQVLRCNLMCGNNLLVLVLVYSHHKKT